METKIFVIGLPSFGDVAERIGEAISQVFEDEPTPCRCKENRAFTSPPKFNPSRPCGCGVPAPEWGIGGKSADENKRFGAGFNVDEPVWDGSESRSSFLKKREAFDEFVDAGERCTELGMCHNDDTPITKCQAVRKPIGTPPVMDKELIGESQFPWWEMGCGW